MIIYYQTKLLISPVQGGVKKWTQIKMALGICWSWIGDKQYLHFSGFLTDHQDRLTKVDEAVQEIMCLFFPGCRQFWSVLVNHCQWLKQWNAC